MQHRFLYPWAEGLLSFWDGQINGCAQLLGETAMLWEHKPSPIIRFHPEHRVLFCWGEMFFKSSENLQFSFILRSWSAKSILSPHPPPPHLWFSILSHNIQAKPK